MENERNWTNANASYRRLWSRSNEWLSLSPIANPCSKCNCEDTAQSRFPRDPGLSTMNVLCHLPFKQCARWRSTGIRSALDRKRRWFSSSFRLISRRENDYRLFFRYEPHHIHMATSRIYSKSATNFWRHAPVIFHWNILTTGIWTWQLEKRFSCKYGLDREVYNFGTVYSSKTEVCRSNPATATWTGQVEKRDFCN